MVFEGLLVAAVVLHAILAWQRFEWALWLAVFLIPSYLLRLTIGGLPTNYFELSVLVLWVVGLLQPQQRAQWSARWQTFPRLPLFLLAAFLVACGVATVLSNEPRVSLGIVRGWVLIPVLVAALVWSTATTCARERRLLNALLASGVGTALLSLLQFHWGERLAGIYDVPNSLALWLTPLFVAAVWLTPYSWKYLLAAIITALALLATQSAAAVAASSTALLFGALYWRHDKNARRVLFASGALLFLALVYFGASGRMTYLLQPWQGGAPNSISVRLQLWSVATALVREQPIVGVGLGQFEPAYQQALHQRFAITPSTERPLPEFVFRDPHNWLLSLWLNTGIVGLVSFAGLHIYALRTGLRATAAPHVQAAALALIALLLVGLVDTIFWKNDLAALQLLLLTLCYGAGVPKFGSLTSTN